MNPFIGQIIIFAGNFAPRGWALCEGQLLPIAQYSALFSILGTTYGGDGRTTFALPDLRGRTPVQAGRGPGLRSYSLGERSGSETTSLTTANLPTSPVTIPASEDDASGDEPSGNVLGISSTPIYASTANTRMANGTLQGGNQPINNLPPSLAVNYIIALEGVFPSRG